MAEREGLLGAARLVPSLRFGTAVALASASPSSINRFLSNLCQDLTYSDFLTRGGEGGITRRSAPRAFGVALTGAIPASSPPPSAGPARRKFTYHLAEREGFEPSMGF